MNTHFRCLESRIDKNNTLYGKFSFNSILSGQGNTFANSLRRSLFSDLSGLAITHFCITSKPGLSYEFATLPGLTESLLDFSLNLKKIVLTGRVVDRDSFASLTPYPLLTNYVIPKGCYARPSGVRSGIEGKCSKDSPLYLLPCPLGKEVVLPTEVSPVLRTGKEVRPVRCTGKDLRDTEGKKHVSKQEVLRRDDTCEAVRIRTIFDGKYVSKQQRDLTTSKKIQNQQKGCNTEGVTKILPSAKSLPIAPIGFLKAKGPAVLRASDLILPPGIRCVHPNQYLGTLAADGALSIKFLIAAGKGFIVQDEILYTSLSRAKLLLSPNFTSYSNLQDGYGLQPLQNNNLASEHRLPCSVKQNYHDNKIKDSRNEYDPVNTCFVNRASKGTQNREQNKESHTVRIKKLSCFLHAPYVLRLLRTNLFTGSFAILASLPVQNTGLTSLPVRSTGRTSYGSKTKSTDTKTSSKSDNLYQKLPINLRFSGRTQLLPMTSKALTHFFTKDLLVTSLSDLNLIVQSSSKVKSKVFVPDSYVHSGGFDTEGKYLPVLHQRCYKKMVKEGTYVRSGTCLPVQSAGQGCVRSKYVGEIESTAQNKKAKFASLVVKYNRYNNLNDELEKEKLLTIAYKAQSNKFSPFLFASLSHKRAKNKSLLTKHALRPYEVVLPTEVSPVLRTGKEVVLPTEVSPVLRTGKEVSPVLCTGKEVGPVLRTGKDLRDTGGKKHVSKHVSPKGKDEVRSKKIQRADLKLASVNDELEQSSGDYASLSYSTCVTNPVVRTCIPVQSTGLTSVGSTGYVVSEAKSKLTTSMQSKKQVRKKPVKQPYRKQATIKGLTQKQYLSPYGGFTNIVNSSKKLSKKQLIWGAEENYYPVLPLDVTFTPVSKVNFQINVDRNSEKNEETIIFEIWTNGSITPKRAIQESSLALAQDFYNLFCHVNEFSSLQFWWKRDSLESKVTRAANSKLLPRTEHNINNSVLYSSLIPKVKNNISPFFDTPKISTNLLNLASLTASTYAIHAKHVVPSKMVSAYLPSSMVPPLATVQNKLPSCFLYPYLPLTGVTPKVLQKDGKRCRGTVSTSYFHAQRTRTYVIPKVRSMYHVPHTKEVHALQESKNQKKDKQIYKQNPGNIVSYKDQKSNKKMHSQVKTCTKVKFPESKNFKLKQKVHYLHAFWRLNVSDLNFSLNTQLLLKKLNINSVYDLHFFILKKSWSLFLNRQQQKEIVKIYLNFGLNSPF